MNDKKKSSRNKTITLLDSERELFENNLFIYNSQDNISLDSVINKTILGDTIEIVKKIPSNSFDLVIIDPPYNINKKFNKFNFKKLNDEEYIDYMDSWFSEVVRTMKPNASLYLCGDWKSSVLMYQTMEKHLTVINRITWQREKGRGSKTNWKNAMEDIWFGVKNPKSYYFDVDSVKQKKKVIAPYKVDGKPKDWEETPDGNFRLTYPSNFWDDITIPFWSMPENTPHPTQKPEKLIAKLILASSAVGDIVFDPFLGSGTTSVVSKKLNRNCVGIEMDKEYALIAEKRLHNAETDRDIQGYVDGTFLDRNMKVK